MTNDIINQIETALAAATAGEWRVSDKHGLCVVVDGEDPDMIADMSPEGSPWTGAREDAALIVLLRNNGAELLRLARMGLDAEDDANEIERNRKLAEVRDAGCEHNRLYTNKGDEVFQSRLGCLDCGEWLTPVRRK